MDKKDKKFFRERLMEIIKKTYGDNLSDDELEQKIVEYESTIETLILTGQAKEMGLLDDYNTKPPLKVDENDIDWSIQSKLDKDVQTSYSVRYGFHKDVPFVAFGLRESKNIYLFSPEQGVLCHDGIVETDTNKFLDILVKEERENKDLVQFVIRTIQNTKKYREVI